jgi:Flp pilus assembly pilin Flp
MKFALSRRRRAQPMVETLLLVILVSLGVVAVVMVLPEAIRTYYNNERDTIASPL